MQNGDNEASAPRSMHTYWLNVEIEDLVDDRFGLPSLSSMSDNAPLKFLGQVYKKTNKKFPIRTSCSTPQMSVNVRVRIPWQKCCRLGWGGNALTRNFRSLRRRRRRRPHPLYHSLNSVKPVTAAAAVLPREKERRREMKEMECETSGKETFVILSQ